METWEVTFEDHDEEASPESPSENGKHNGKRNVGKAERVASAIVGGGLVGYGIKKRSPGSLLLALAGAGLLYRGATGYCEAYERLGINTTREHSEEVPQDFHVEKSITVLRTPKELFRFWRELENLPRFMESLESVTELDELRSHWVVSGPLGKKVEWDAEIFNEKESELIAWRSLSHADVPHAGSVHFQETRGRGTKVSVTLNYNAPLGKVSTLFAKLFGAEPGQLIEHNLKRFKQLMEAGEIPTIEGQPSGREEIESTAQRKPHKLASKTPIGTLPQAREGVA